MDRLQRQRVPGTKLVVPEMPAGMVSRPRLLSMLDRAGDSPVTVVCAAAGWGKTLLLTEWVRRHGVATTAWISLDADDNDEPRFWSGVLDALSRCAAVPAASPLRTLAVPAGPGGYPRFLAEVVNGLQELPQPVWLVLDDLQEITDPRPLHGLETLLRHQPAALHMVLSTRHDPPLPLARLRLADQVSEIRAEDLRFTATEAGALLHAAGIRLAPAQLNLLLEQLEGWSAGLRLAVLCLDETDAPGRHVTDFAVDSWAVGDYLTEEVLTPLPQAVRELATAVSVCEQVPMELAVALSGRDDAGVLLDELTQHTALVTWLDDAPRTCHLHPLLRTYLVTELVRRAPRRAARLHAVAARWFAGHGAPATAVTHVSQAADIDLAAAFAERHVIDLVLSGDHEPVRRVLDVLGPRRIAENSRLSLISALLHLEWGVSCAAERDLANAETAWPVEPDADLMTLGEVVRARRAQVAWDLRAMVDTVTRIKDRPETRSSLRSLGMFLVGGALLASNDRALAEQRLRAALRYARGQGHHYVAAQCLTTLGELAAEEGDYPGMVELATEADELNSRRGWQQTIGAMLTGVLLGYGALLRADPATCLRHAERVDPLVSPAGSVVNRQLTDVVETLRGAAEFALGDWVAGAHRIHGAQASVRDEQVSPHQAALCAMLGHRAAMLLGWGKSAAQVLDWAQDRLREVGEVEIMRARAHLAIGRHNVAGKVIKPLLDDPSALVLRWSIVEAWLIAAEVAAGAHDAVGTRRALRQALSHADHLDVLYPVVFASVPVVDLVVGHLGTLGSADGVARRALTMRRDLHLTAMPAPLTPSEQEILHLLPTLRSFDEIAEHLMVSPNTVKTHVRSIYAKLGVSRRRNAVEVASERGLLDSEHIFFD